MVELACKYDKPVRIGVNWGSLDQDLLARIMDENSRKAVPLDATEMMRHAMVTSALESAAKAEEVGLAGEKIILSCKVSSVQDLIAIYRELAKRADYALHLGLTEAGMGSKGIVASTAALSVLLQEGIGDTIRVSLTPEPGGSRSQEVIVAQKSCKPWVCVPLRRWWRLARGVAGRPVRFSRSWLARCRILFAPKCRNGSCITTAPKHDAGRDGLHCQRTRRVEACQYRHFVAGTGEAPSAPVYEDGEKTVTLKGDNIANEFKQIIERYVERTYTKKLKA